MDKLKSLAEDARNDRPIHWELVEEFIAVEPKTRPESSHGTHVAGILGGRADRERTHAPADGMCPDIRLYDFRVLSKGLTIRNSQSLPRCSLFVTLTTGVAL